MPQVPGTKGIHNWGGKRKGVVVAGSDGMKTKLGYLAAGYGLTVAFSLALQFLPPVIPVLRTSLGISASQAGTLMSSLAVLGIVVSPLVGYLADRWGGRAVGLLGIGLLLATEAWFALSRSYVSLLFARLCMGTGSAMLSILGAQILRFLALFHHEPTDYVEISRRLYENQNTEEIFKRAKEHWRG